MDTQSTSMTSVPRFRGEMMRQIYRVWLFRKLLPVLIVEIAVIAGMIYGIARVVFLQRVFENAANVLFNNPGGMVNFIVSAFAHAPVVTKLLVFGLALLIALILRHLTQGMLRFILVRSNYFSKIK